MVTPLGLPPSLGVCEQERQPSSSTFRGEEEKVGAPSRRSGRSGSGREVEGILDVARLKQPSPSPVILEKLLMLAIGRLELVSQVRAATLEKETARIKPGSSAPPGRPDHTRERLLKAYGDCDDNWERIKIVKEAQRLARVAILPGDLRKRRGTKEWRKAIATDARASATVGLDFGVSASYVRKLRGEALRGL
jgi:hypothetical protein